MVDTVLKMQNSIKTRDWIQKTLDPNDKDYWVAVRQQPHRLTFANKRAYIPGDWSDENIYVYPTVSMGECILLDMQQGVVNYILMRLGTVHKAAFVRVTDHPRTLIFSNTYTNFPDWDGPTSLDDPRVIDPGLVAGLVTPGGNWLPGDELYLRIFEQLLGIETTPEVLVALLNEAYTTENIEGLLENPTVFVEELSTVHNIEVDDIVRANLNETIINHGDLFRTINRHNF